MPDEVISYGKDLRKEEIMLPYKFFQTGRLCQEEFQTKKW